MRVLAPIIVAVIPATLVFAQPATAPSKPKPKAEATSAPAMRADGTQQPAIRRPERDITQILSRRVPQVSFESVSLQKVMEWVQAYTGVMVYVRYAVLEQHGITRDTPITVKASDATLKQVLWVIMNEAAGATGVTLAYEASSDLILFSTHEDLSSQMVSRAYDFKDIHVDVPYFWREGIFDASKAGMEGKVFRTRVHRQVHSRSLGGDLLTDAISDSQQPPSLPPEVETDDEALQEFMEFILNTIEPESWVVSGMGGKGTIFPYKGRLIIRNSLYVHNILMGEDKP